MAISPFRVPHDFYPTPAEGTRALLAVETFDGTIWEPACGDGGIAKHLVLAGYEVVSTDLVDRGYGQGGVNFLSETATRAKHIITNPPYGSGLADQFVRHALQLTRATGGTVAMLLDLAGLAHSLRHPLWVSYPPANVYVLDELICQPAGIPTFTKATFRYCWVLWKPTHAGDTRLRWLTTRTFKVPPYPQRGRR
jgi:hypothetical protein